MAKTKLEEAACIANLHQSAKITSSITLFEKNSVCNINYQTQWPGQTTCYPANSGRGSLYVGLFKGKPPQVTVSTPTSVTNPPPPPPNNAVDGYFTMDPAGQWETTLGWGSNWSAGLYAYNINAPGWYLIVGVGPTVNTNDAPEGDD